MSSPNEISSLSFIYDNENLPRRPINTRIRPMNFEAHLMPPPTRFPWNSNEMNWTNNSANVIINGVMEFKGDDHLFESKTKNLTKRKAATDEDQLNISLQPITKQQITDEKMAIHLNSLHISSTYTSHESKPPSWDDASSSSSSSSSMEPETSQINYCSKGSSNCDSTEKFQNQHLNNNNDKNSSNFSITMSSKDLEQKLRNAQRITICEEVRRIQSDSILPESIIERIERPCTALVLWQPPPPSLQMLSSQTNKYLTTKYLKNKAGNIEISGESTRQYVGTVCTANNKNNNNNPTNNNVNIRIDDEEIDSNNLMDFDMDL